MNKLAASVVVVLLVAGSALLLQARGEQPATAPATQPDGDGVVTPSGLQIETLTPGTGAARGDAIFVHYAGRLTDGTQFDSSYDRGEPISLAHVGLPGTPLAFHGDLLANVLVKFCTVLTFEAEGESVVCGHNEVAANLA